MASMHEEWPTNTSSNVHTALGTQANAGFWELMCFYVWAAQTDISFLNKARKQGRSMFSILEWVHMLSTHMLNLADNFHRSAADEIGHCSFQPWRLFTVAWNAANGFGFSSPLLTFYCGLMIFLCRPWTCGKTLQCTTHPKGMRWHMVT